MNIIDITPTYAVSPQIAPEDIPAIKAAGITRIICNRPDEEIPPELRADVIGRAAEAEGLDFAVLPVTHHGLTLDTVTEHGQLSDVPGKVLAYCNSGTRSSMIWALAQAGTMPTADILQALSGAGYPMPGLGQTLDALAAQPG